jgi:hypothetical protein
LLILNDSLYNFGPGIPGLFRHPLKKESHPLLPGALSTYGSQHVIVFSLVLLEKGAEVKAG